MLYNHSKKDFKVQTSGAIYNGDLNGI